MMIDMNEEPKIDAYGFDQDGMSDETGTKYDTWGFDSQGFNSEGFDKQGFNKKGWSKEFINKDTGKKYDLEGFDNKNFDIKGIHKDTGTKYDAWGFDNQGYHKDTKTDRDENGLKRIDIMGFECIERLAKEQKLFFKKKTIQAVDIVYLKKRKKYFVVAVDKMGDLLHIATSTRRSLAMSYLRRKTLSWLGYKYTPKGYQKITSED